MSEDNKVDSKEQLKEFAKKLGRVEAKTHAGARSRQPKQSLLDASDVQAQHPDKKIRWSSLANPDKMEIRKHEGYERLPVSEGGRQVGNNVLMALSKEDYDHRVAEQKKVNEQRLKQHNREVEEMAEQVAKVLRDQHGKSVSADDIIVKG